MQSSIAISLTHCFQSEKIKLKNKSLNQLDKLIFIENRRSTLTNRSKAKKD